MNILHNKVDSTQSVTYPRNQRASIMLSSIPLPDDLRAFISSSQWTFAKTMPEWPHEYIVRHRVDEKLFVRLVHHIRAHGFEGRFYRKVLTYYAAYGLLYWTMGEPLEETTIINRCREEDSYENRLKKGTLPENNSNAQKLLRFP